MEDDKKLSEELKNFLEHHGYIAEIVEPKEYTTEIILSKNFDLLLLDISYFIFCKFYTFFLCI